MSAPADRNLLFGILAVQLDFVAKDALIEAMHAWVLDKAKPLGDILRDQGHLSGERLQLLSALVGEHLKQHGGDAQRSLAAVSSVDPWVRSGLRALADADVQASVAHIRPTPPDPDRTVDRALTVAPAGSNGRYRILRSHARGGLGEVYVAEDTELRREVALKEIQADYAGDPASRDRFLLEAEITGGLEHPGIVPVYGLGTYADGRPYYAMRFVRGDNLQQAVKRFHAGGGRYDSLAFRQLLRRFIDVCNAVAYAHSRGVLHRDLKPGNVMLGKYGETLVVDWGLAKPVGRPEAAGGDERTLRPAVGSGSAATRAGQAVGTPAYMSPEQAAGAVEDLGPATDVYGLGATLYAVLTGRPPREGDAGDVIGQALRGEFRPPRDANPAVPAALDAVCQKAMALDPADRYDSALALAADVDRWLADEPVSAYREPLSARARRWVRKHARLATGLGAALAVGAAGLGFLALERERARAALAAEQAETAKERDAKEEERRRATAARNRAREALDAMVSGMAGDALAAQDAVTPEQRAFLEGVLKYYQEFAAEPGEDREARERVADAHYRLSRVYYRLGRTDEGLAVSRRAVELYRSLAADFPGEPEYRAQLARNQHNVAWGLSRLNRRGAEVEYQAATDGWAALVRDFPAVPEYRAYLATARSRLAGAYLARGRRKDAAAAADAALAAFGTVDAGTLAAANARNSFADGRSILGGVMGGLGRRDEAVAQYRAAAAAREALAADFPGSLEHRAGLARARQELGRVLFTQGRLEEAESECRAALPILVKLAAEYPTAPEYRGRLATCRSYLGAVLESLGRAADAEAQVRESLAVRAALAAAFPAEPSSRQNLAHCHNELGIFLERLGRLREAEAEFRAALEIQSKLAAEFPAVPLYAITAGGNCCNLGNVSAKNGDTAAALDWYARAAAALEPAHRADPQRAMAWQFLANTYLGRTRVLAKLGRARETLADWDRLVGEAAGPGQTYFRTRRAVALALAGNPAGAAAEAEELARPGASAATLFDAASVLALAAAADQGTADRYADRAVALLRRAAAEGYRDWSDLIRDPDLDALRRRADFADLLWDLADGPAAAK